MADAATFIASWFTPSSLFIIVNLVIGTIAITSRFTSSSAPPKNEEPPPPQLSRSSSLLHRLSSFNLSFYQHQPTPAETHYAPPESSESTQTQFVRTPSLLERVRSFRYPETQYTQPEPETENIYTDPKEPQLVRSPSLLERVRSMSFSRLYRSDSLHREEEEKEEPNPTGLDDSGKVEMKKSASERGMLCESGEEDEETVQRRRPATASASCREEDEEVDTKADDFINRFKKQLRLQRLDSLLRYRSERNAIRGN